MRILFLLVFIIGSLFAEITVELKKGWQLIGVPTYLENMSAFNDKNVEIVWGYDGETQSWKGYSPDTSLEQKLIEKDIALLSSLEPWQAVWVFSKEAWVLHVKDSKEPTQMRNNIITLYKGWNLIEIPQDSVISEKFFGDALLWKYSTDSQWLSNDKSLNFPSIEAIAVNEGLWVKSKSRRDIVVDEELSKLNTFKDEESMLSYIRTMLKLNNYRYYEYPETINDTVAGGDISASPDDNKDATSTNLQEEGVDEGDILKNDGTYIYSVDNTNAKIIVTSFDKMIAQDYKPLQEIDMQDKNVVAMFLQNNRLSVISNKSYNYIYDKPVASSNRSLMPYYGNASQHFTLDIFDVSDVSAIHTIGSYDIDGYYQDSRLIEGKLFLISQFSPNIQGSENLIPSISDGVKSSALVTPSKFYAPNKLNQRANITSINRFDIESAALEDTLSFLGNTHTYYASTSSLYLVSSEYPYYMNYLYSKIQETIYKFSLGDTFAYKGRGKVDGSMLNQFSMSEKDEYLRVATTVGQAWWNAETINSVYTLKEENETLKIKGTLTGLGKKGETIKAVRFMGDRGFVVTFRQTDPLYTLDMSDPLHPIKVGELSIPGFSSYLHVMDENRVLSIGRDADEKGRALALQVSLFDISDFAHPRLASKISIGDSSLHSATRSEAEYNHKAFVYRASDLIFGFPFTDSVDGSYTENFGLYQVDGMNINTLHTITTNTPNNWGDSARGLIFNDNDSVHATLFKGSHIMSEIVK